MDEKPFIPAVRFELASRDYRPLVAIVFFMLLILTLIFAIVFPLTATAPIVSLVFLVGWSVVTVLSFRNRKGVVFNEDGVVSRGKFMAWSDMALYYFYETEDSEGNVSNYLGLRQKGGTRDMSVYLDNLDYDGDMADHIRPFGEAYGVPRGYAEQG